MINSHHEAWRGLIARVLRDRDTDHAYRAKISRGLTRETEYYAYPYVLPYAESAQEQDPLLRAAAIAALHRTTPFVADGLSVRFGRSLSQMSSRRAREKSANLEDRFLALDPAKPDVFAQRVMTISQMSLDDVTLTIDRLLTINESLTTPVAVDYYNLTRLLMRWGNGLSQDSLAVRRSVQRDYYSRMPARAVAADKSN